MKFVFKRFIRRSLSIVLTFAVIMCSLTVSLSAFAQATAAALMRGLIRKTSIPK